MPAEYLNPATPVNIHISGFGRGSRIKFVGVPSHNATQFSINLRTSSNIAFSFLTLFDERAVVCNNQLNNVWGTEERYGDFPFNRGQNFTLEFVAAGGEIEVYYDGRMLTRFVERDTTSNISIVQVEGDVKIHSIQTD